MVIGALLVFLLGESRYVSEHTVMIIEDYQQMSRINIIYRPREISRNFVSVFPFRLI